MEENWMQDGSGLDADWKQNGSRLEADLKQTLSDGLRNESVKI